jgi:predicted amino acid dehydrogenase
MNEYFYADSDSHDIVKNRDLTGYCAVVVGANRGLGLEICRTLAFKNCHVIMACRDKPAADSALNSITKERVDITFFYSVFKTNFLIRNF